MQDSLHPRTLPTCDVVSSLHPTYMWGPVKTHYNTQCQGSPPPPPHYLCKQSHTRHAIAHAHKSTAHKSTRAHAPKTLILRPHSCCSGTHFASTGWQRLIECLKLQVIFRKRVTNYRALLRKMTCKDKASYGTSTPCTHTTHFSSSHHFTELTPDTHSFLPLTTIRNQE